jgi:predicted nucleic acid-binding protein
MQLADTSAWIEYLRKTGSGADRAMRSLIELGELAVTDVVIMEVLAGTTDPGIVSALHRAVDFAHYLPQAPRDDAEAAAAIFRQCRIAGETPRQLTDCLLAAVAIRNQVTVLHRDRDFEVIARHSDLAVVSA